MLDKCHFFFLNELDIIEENIHLHTIFLYIIINDFLNFLPIFSFFTHEWKNCDLAVALINYQFKN